MSEVMNAKITSTSLGSEDHGILTAWLDLDYGGSGQGFGGFAMDEWDEVRKARIGTAFGTEYIKRILATLEVSKWEKLPGTVCRVRATHTGVEEIGHFLKDQWFNPRALAQENLVATPRNREPFTPQGNPYTAGSDPAITHIGRMTEMPEPVCNAVFEAKVATSERTFTLRAESIRGLLLEMEKCEFTSPMVPLLVYPTKGSRQFASTNKGE